MDELWKWKKTGCGRESCTENVDSLFPHRFPVSPEESWDQVQRHWGEGVVLVVHSGWCRRCSTGWIGIPHGREEVLPRWRGRCCNSPRVLCQYVNYACCSTIMCKMVYACTGQCLWTRFVLLRSASLLFTLLLRSGLQPEAAPQVERLSNAQRAKVSTMFYTGTRMRAYAANWSSIYRAFMVAIVGDCRQNECNLPSAEPAYALW